LTETIRAFVAIAMPEAVRAALGVAVAEISATRDIRPVRPEGIHLTLKFLGDIDPARVGPISRAMEGVGRAAPPFSLSLGSTGMFPETGGPPRVLWVGLTGHLEPLQTLWVTLEDATSALGFPRDRRAFNPHLTLARIRDGAASADRQTAAAALSRVRLGDELRIPVNSMELMRSTLGPEGASYERLATARLIG
jgi:2'-5' RNA ligase